MKTISKQILKIVFALSIFAFTQGCSTGACTNVPQRPAQGLVTKNPNGELVATADEAHATDATTEDSKKLEDGRVKVSKPSGALQCDKKTGTTPAKMAEILKAKKIKVFKSSSQSDDQMHVQVCGAPTGQLNVFEINAKDLPKALKLGFVEQK